MRIPAPQLRPGQAEARALVEVLGLDVVSLAVVVARLERALVLVGPLGVDQRRGLLPGRRPLKAHPPRLLESLGLAAAGLLDRPEGLAALAVEAIGIGIHRVLARV